MLNVRKCFLSVIAIALFLLIGCAAGTVAEHPGDKGEGKSVQGWFDPLALNDDDIIIRGMSMPSFNSESDTVSANIDYDLMTEGYRVQIYTTQDLYEADSILGVADSVFFGEAYLRFDAPNYKIRVGNLTSRSNAEELQRYSRGVGFPRSWVLRTSVFVNPRKKETQPAKAEEESE